MHTFVNISTSMYVYKTTVHIYSPAYLAFSFSRYHLSLARFHIFTLSFCFSLEFINALVDMYSGQSSDQRVWNAMFFLYFLKFLINSTKHIL